MIRIVFLILILVTANQFTYAQVQHSGWLASFNTIKINKAISVHFDAQLRSTDGLKNVQTLLLRPGVNYHINKKFTATAGYAFINNRRTVGSTIGYLAEHRIWEQLLYNHPIKNIATSHRLRFEQRFIPNAVAINNELEKDGHAQAYRLRYFIRNVIPLTNQKGFKKGVFTALQNEVFVNTGNKSAVNGKFFDQNRLYVAIGYRLPNKVDIEAGYMNQYIKGRTNITNNHIAQIAVYKRL
jgi:hypothetical protein